MPLINYEVNLILNWSANCVIVYTNVANQNATFTITETKLYVPVVTLSTQDNTKLWTQIKSGFKGTINWNKYLSNLELLAQNPNLNYLVELNFQGINTFCSGIWKWYIQNKQYKILSPKCRNKRL